MFVQKVDSDVEYRIVLPDGTVKHIHGLAHPVLGPNEELIEVVGTVVDITERKDAEEELRRSKAYLTEAQRLSHTGSWAWDVATKRSVHWSPEHYRVFGFAPDEGIPSDEEFFERIHPQDRRRVIENFERAIFREKSDFDVDYRIVLPGGSIKHVRSIGHPVFKASGDLVEFVGTAVDVTERKHAEAARDKLRELEAELAHKSRVSTIGELTASLAHEIKQPIGAAVTNAEACLRFLDRDRPDVPEAREAASEMVRDARRVGDIIDRVRSLYQKGSSQLETIEVNEVIGEMAVMVQNEANRHSVTIRTDLAEGLPKVMADRVQLQQVLMNLMLNGIEAMLNKGGELHLKSQLAEDGQVLISVTDAGIGLPTEKTDQIFNAFFTTKPHGTGLGLAITRSIVESHGGRIWATANSGTGTTFRFTLPQRRATHA
jgi:PAS domain S-box-containing protein